MILNKSKQYFTFYKIAVILFFLVTNFRFYSAIKFDQITNIYYFLLVINLILFFGSYFLIPFTSQRIKILTLLIFLILYGLYFKDYAILYASLYCLLLSVFTIEEIVQITFVAYLITFVSLALLSLCGILPLYYDNGKSGTISYSGLLLGFSFKNTTGYFLLFLILSLAILTNNRILIYILTFVSIYVEFYLIKDRTAAIILIMFLVIYFFKKQKIKLKILYNTLFLFPLILIMISFILIKMWSTGTETIRVINDLLSGRVYIWNMEWTLYSPRLFPQLIGVGNFYDPSSQIPLDGFFALSPLQDGILYFVFIIILLMTAIKKILKKNNYNLLICFIFLMICGFTEMIPLSSISWLLPISFICLFSNESEK